MKHQSEKNFWGGINLYLWATSASGSAALPTGIQLIPETPVVDMNLSFSDAIKNLKMAAMLTGRFSYEDFSFIYDVAYVKLNFYNVDTVKLGRYRSADVVAKLFNGDLEIGYLLPITSAKLKLEVYAGTRITSLNNTLSYLNIRDSITNFAQSKTWFDPIIGLDGLYDFSKKWFIYGKGDIGGFGASSKITWLLMAVGGYCISSHWNATIGYKWLKVDYDKDYFLWNVSQYGFLASVGYNF